LYSRRRLLIVLALALTLSLAASPLQEAQSHYADLDYEGCVTALAPSLARLHGAQRATAEMYFGLCQFALGKESEARRHLEAALRIDPTLRSPAAASPKERELFEDVARAVAASPRPASSGKKQPAAKEPEAHAEKPTEAPPPAATDKPAAEPAKPPPAAVATTPVPAPAPNAAPASATNVTAAVEPVSPPSRVPPAVLTAAAVLFAGTGGVMAFNAKLWESAGNSSTLLQVETPRYANEASNRMLAADVLFAAAGVSAVIAVWLWIRAFSG
jgi:hypothetical protein